MKSKLLALSLMTILGGTMFLVMVVLMQSRIGRPVGSIQSDDTAAATGPPAAFAMKGIAQSLSFAKDALARQRQSEGCRALDAAMRASEVGKEAFKATEAGTTFEALNRTVMQARIALQNDNASRAAQLVDRAVGLIPLESAKVATHPSRIQEYAGATVINAEGVRIGEVTRIEDGSLGLSIGGYYNVFGFLSFGGQELRVHPEQVLFGTRKRAGTTLVMLPSLATSSKQVASSLQPTQ